MKMNIMMIVVMLATVVQSSLCMEQKKGIDRDKMPLGSKVFYGWTGLSGVSLASSILYNDMARTKPHAASTMYFVDTLKKKKYLKYARYSRNVSLFAALPFISLVGTTGISSILGSGAPASSLYKILGSPYTFMVSKPVDIYEKLKAEKTT